MATLVINVSRVPQHVGLILANGKKSFSRIMHRSRAPIEPGAIVDPRWLAMNPGVVKVVDVPERVVKQAKTNASKPAAVYEVKPSAITAPTTTSSEKGVE